MSANLHVALALALGVPTSRTDAQLIAQVERLRGLADGSRHESGGAAANPDPPDVALFELGAR